MQVGMQAQESSPPWTAPLTVQVWRAINYDVQAPGAGSGGLFPFSQYKKNRAPEATRRSGPLEHGDYFGRRP